MFLLPYSPPVPVAGVDPIDSESAALGIVSAVMSHPPQPEIVAVFLDAARRGDKVLVVGGAPLPDQVFGIADLVESLADRVPDLDALLLATIRPDGGDDAGDAARWHELDARLAAVGVELVEWLVLGPGRISRPRCQARQPARWS